MEHSLVVSLNTSSKQSYRHIHLHHSYCFNTAVVAWSETGPKNLLPVTITEPYLTSNRFPFDDLRKAQNLDRVHKLVAVA